jgi:hypothetical protein
MAAAAAYGNGGAAVAAFIPGGYRPSRMEADETAAETLAGASEPFGFADVRVRAIAQRAWIEWSIWRANANARTRPGHIRVGNERPGLIFRPPYWMVIADTGS